MAKNFDIPDDGYSKSRDAIFICVASGAVFRANNKKAELVTLGFVVI